MDLGVNKCQCVYFLKTVYKFVFIDGMEFRFGKHVCIIMPDTAPKIKFERTASFGAEILTYDIATDHLTGIRDRLAREVVTCPPPSVSTLTQSPRMVDRL